MVLAFLQFCNFGKLDYPNVQECAYPKIYFTWYFLLILYQNRTDLSIIPNFIFKKNVGMNDAYKRNDHKTFKILT